MNKVLTIILSYFIFTFLLLLFFLGLFFVAGVTLDDGPRRVLVVVCTLLGYLPTMAYAVSTTKDL